MSRSAPTYDNVRAPPGYIAGRGRGAVGFQTRSDIGNASADKPKEASLDNSQFDNFSGYSGSIVSQSEYDREDEDADKIYEAIDQRMQARRKRKRDEDDSKSATSTETEISSAQSISDQFADLKRNLKSVTEDEWNAIPDVGDYSLKYKQKKREEVFTPLPDTVLHAATSSADGKSGSTTTEENGQSGTVQNLSGLASSRGKLMSMNLDKMSDSVSGQTVIDPKGYLTSLAAEKISTSAEIGDIKKARLLLKSVRDTNPKHGPGWIAAARVEEFAGKALAARKIIKDGCDACSDSEDVWLEAVRLQENPEMGKGVCRMGILKLPQSVKLYLKAVELEVGEAEKRKVLRKALEAINNSVKLWKYAIELEDVDDARIMLGQAVVYCPKSVDMWLALARLETYENARRVLNNARKELPAELAIWIAAAKLEEAQNNNEVVDKVVEKAVKLLSMSDNVIIKRDGWLREAETCESSGAIYTCGAIVRNCLSLGVDVEDRIRTWVADAEGAYERGSIESARAIYAYILKNFNSKRSVWVKAVELEKKHGSVKSVEEILRQAVTSCPTAEILWLMFAKEKWVGEGDVAAAREILTEAFAANPNCEQIWLAAAKLEWENGELKRARTLLTRARTQCGGERVFLKSALLEREIGDFELCLNLLEEGIKKHKTFHKFFLMGADVCAQQGGEEKIAVAKKWFNNGLKACPNCIDLWIMASRFEEELEGGSVAKSRSLLEVARLKNESNDKLWLEAIRLERRHAGEGEDGKGANILMAKALQQCPNSGFLWSEEIVTSPRADQKRKSMDAIKNCPDDSNVIAAVAGLFSREGKVEKARKWFFRAVSLEEGNGDSWARWFAFEREFGSEEGVKGVAEKCKGVAEGMKGLVWNGIAKGVGMRGKGVEELLMLVSDKMMIK